MAAIIPLAVAENAAIAIPLPTCEQRRHSPQNVPEAIANLRQPPDLRFPQTPWPQAALDSDALRDGSKVGVVPFADEGKVPMGQPLGVELDGRLFTDLSLLTPENPITPTNDFYIRTRASKLLDARKPWSIQLGGLIEKPITLRAVDVEKMARPMGLHLMECAGNSRSAHFGMLSVADWHGVPVQEILQEAKPTSSSVRILISGFDQYSSESRSSIPGASWIFTSEQLKTSGAFLATKMNGQPLTPDHGAPVRLLVPGWYGCACIKWVNEISFVPDDAPATSQMQEYASRTMQTGVPVLAQDYRPALIDLAAMPIRVEKWFVRGKIKFRVAGHPVGRLQPHRRSRNTLQPRRKLRAGRRVPVIRKRSVALLEPGLDPASLRKIFHSPAPEKSKPNSATTKLRLLRAHN